MTGRLITSAASIAAQYLLIGLGLGLVGCSTPTNEPLPTAYGQADGPRFAASVNGVTVLAELFAKAGHTVTSEENLSPQLNNSADVIVWAPNDFDVPPLATVQWFDTWLQEKPDRTLIYIGRDFDAAPVYWRKILAQTPPDKAAAVKDQLAQAEERFEFERMQLPATAECSWFAINNSSPHRDVRTLNGDWSAGIDASKVEIELNSRLVPTAAAEILLGSDGDAIVSRLLPPAGPNRGNWLSFDVPRSQLIMIANGSFLLNLPLVNHEHRKLAAQLIESVGTAKKVVFLDSLEGGSIRRSSPNDQQLPHSMLDIFGIWPLSVILTQWGLVLLLFCFSRWPIFGPPRDPAPPTASDFGRHVAALGEALELTRDEAFATARWQQYQEQVRSKGGGLQPSGGRLGSGGRKVRPENFRAS